MGPAACGKPHVNDLLTPLPLPAQVYTKMGYFQNATFWHKFFYCFGLTVCQGLSLHVVFGTTFITMLGPGMALRGKDPSAVHQAADAMRSEYEKVAVSFHLSVHCFLWIVSVAFAWSAALSHWAGSVTLSLFAVVISVVIARNTMAIEASFPLRRLEKSRGLIVGFFVRNTRTKASGDKPLEDRESSDILMNPAAGSLAATRGSPSMAQASSPAGSSLATFFRSKSSKQNHVEGSSVAVGAGSAAMQSRGAGGESWSGTAARARVPRVEPHASELL